MQRKLVFGVFLFLIALIITLFAKAQFTSLRGEDDGKKGVENDMAGKWNDVSRLSGYTYRQWGLRFSSPDTDVPGYPKASRLFRKGTWLIPTERNLYYDRMDEDSVGSLSRLNLNLETHYFPWERIGLGLEVQYDHTSSKNGSETVTSDFIAYGHVTYGFPINPKWGIYIRGGAGIGSGKTEITQGTNSQEIKCDVFSYKFEVGAPVHLNHNLYLNPLLSYKNTSKDFDVEEQIESGVRIGVGLVSYLNCGDEEDYLDTMSFSIRRNRYAPGVSFIGFHSMTSYSTGKTEFKFNSQSFEENYNRFNLKVDYTFQVFQNFGLGAEVGFRSSKVESESSDFESIRNYILFAPKATYNFPTTNWLNDAFLTFGGGIGSRKTETTISGFTNEQKDKISVIGGGLGYNWFISKSSMFTFTAGYESITEKDSENTDQKFKESGFTFQVGFRTGLGIRGTDY
jgi:Outer membrane protein beta-barrel domain